MTPFFIPNEKNKTLAELKKALKKIKLAIEKKRYKNLLSLFLQKIVFVFIFIGLGVIISVNIVIFTNSKKLRI